MVVISSFSLGTNAETNPTEAKHDHKKETKTIMHFIQPLVILRKPIIIPPNVIGKEQYPNKHII